VTSRGAPIVYHRCSGIIFTLHGTDKDTFKCTVLLKPKYDIKVDGEVDGILNFALTKTVPSHAVAALSPGKKMITYATARC
jgi:mRNA degradation ribonuclease J1/J2